MPIDDSDRYRLIAEAIPQLVWLDSPEGEPVYANARWREYAGSGSRSDRRQAVHPEDAPRLASERARALRDGTAMETELRLQGRDGKYRWFLLRSTPIRAESGAITGWIETATDIDKQKRAQAQQAFFALAGDVLSSTLDVGSTLERIARLAIASLGSWCQIDVPDAQGRLRVAVVAHQDPAKEAILAQLVDQRIYNEAAIVGPPGVLHTGKPQLLPRVSEHAVREVIPDPRHRDVYRRIGYASGLMVPLAIRGRVLGSLGIASADPSRLYTEFDIATAAELGRRGATALDNAHSFAREHRLATTLQRALLPAALPLTPAVSFDSAYAAAASDRGEAVGGDWYDAFAFGDCVAISMGDVAGHGVEAAVTMSLARQAIRSGGLQHRAPRDVLAHANEVLALETHRPMVTALFAVFDPNAHELQYSIAGHPQPILVDDDGHVTALSGAGPPLGEVFDPDLLETHRLPLPRDAALVFYTDGLIEYRRDLIAAQDRLRRNVQDRYFLSEESPAQAIIDGMLDAPQRDDIAVLVMRVHDPAPDSLRMTMPARARSAPLLRERLRAYALQNGAGDNTLYRMLNAVGEALANAVQHAGAQNDPGTIALHARREGEEFLVEVHAGPTGGSGRAHGKRALAIMESQAKSVQIRRDAEGTTVLLRF